MAGRASTTALVLVLSQVWHLGAAVRVVQDVQIDTLAVDEALVPVTSVLHEAHHFSSNGTGTGSLIEEQWGIPNFVGGGIIWPDCPQSYALKDFVQESAAWCDPDKVPEEKRAPPKLQGLYWMKDMKLEDIAVCMSTGEWDPQTLTLKLVVYRDFMFIKNWKGNFMASVAYQLGMTYLIAFEDESLSNAQITPTATGGILQRAMGLLPMWFFDFIADFPIHEQPGASPGEKWSRPSWFGIGPAKVFTNQYHLWRVLDGGLNVLSDNHAFMFRQMYPRVQETEIIRYYDKRGYLPFSTCASEAPALEDPLKCGQGIFLQTNRQPTIGLLHVVPDETPKPFLRTSIGEDCKLDYFVSCADGEVEVTEGKHCEGNHVSSVLIHSPTGYAGKVRRDWKVCARSASSYTLVLTDPLIDLTWDVPLPPGTEVTGCLHIYPADTYTHLAAVRGERSVQRDALIQVKEELGGCPTVTTAQGRLDRGLDFQDQSSWDLLGLSGGGSAINSLGPWMYLLQKAAAAKAEQWARGVAPWGEQPGVLDKAAGAVIFATNAAFLGAATKSNRTTGFRALAEVNCAQPSPFVDGPQVFRHEDVAGSAGSGHQRRGYATATIKQVDSCFDATVPLFLSTGSPEHTQFRQLLDEAGFDRLTSVELAGIVGGANSESGAPAPTEMEVGRLVLPLVMQAIWDKAPPSDEVVDEILPYLKVGKLCIFGEVGESLLKVSGSHAKVQAARKAMVEYGADSARAGELHKTLQKPAYAAVKAQYERRAAERGSGNATHLLISNVADAVLFAGLLGTSDMTTKCVAYQWRDPAHVRMYRSDSLAYLHELMRYDGAVTSFTTGFDKPTDAKIEGQEVHFPTGAPIQMSLGTANRDPLVFEDPSAFNPEREDIGEQVAWNGRLKYVMERDYEHAPRFCPGYHLSVKVAQAVCTHLTKGLPAHGSRGKETRAGLVKIIKKDSNFFGEVAMVSHHVSADVMSTLPSGVRDLGEKAYQLYSGLAVEWGSYCVVSPADRGFIGCFAPHELEEIDDRGSLVRTLADEAALCPAWVGSLLDGLVESASSQYINAPTSIWAGVAEAVFGKKTPQKLSADWAGPYTLAMYVAIKAQLSAYVTRTNGSIAMPTHIGRTELLQIGRVQAPTVDIDRPGDSQDCMPSRMPGVSVFLPSTNCFQNAIRGLGIDADGSFDDALDEEGKNEWGPLLSPKGVRAFARKKDWVLSWWSPYTLGDGRDMWPKVEVNFAARFLKADTWDDGLERAMAFNLIGSHRAESEEGGRFGELAIAFALKLNALSQIPTRPHFGKFGGDMYFDQDGLPLLIQKPDQSLVRRGEADWQYWKFVWRSSLVTGITLVDHLHLTHFRAANVLAQVTRGSLRPDHPMRRFMSVFTFGSVDVNLAAMYALIGPGHALHRSTPFSDFETLSDVVPKELPDLLEAHRPFRNATAWEKMPRLLRDAPYWADGKLLYAALQRLVARFTDVYREEWCDPVTGALLDWEMQAFLANIIAANEAGGYAGLSADDVGSSQCQDLQERTVAGIFTVTGWHRHVGTVGDYYADPDLASFSWKQGERYPRPRQHMILSVIAAFTATGQPKLNEDYTHVLAGIHKEQQAVDVWHQFMAELGEVERQVKARNRLREERGDLANIHADPSVVECSVAV